MTEIVEFWFILVDKIYDNSYKLHRPLVSIYSLFYSYFLKRFICRCIRYYLFKTYKFIKPNTFTENQILNILSYSALSFILYKSTVSFPETKKCSLLPHLLPTICVFVAAHAAPIGVCIN